MKNHKIKGLIEKHPDLIFIIIMIIGMMINVATYVNYAPRLETWIVYLLGVMQLIPVVSIIIFVFVGILKKTKKELDNKLKDKDNLIAKQMRKINDDKETVKWGEEATRQYNELQSEVAAQIAEYEDELVLYRKREAIFKKLYVREDYPQKVYRFVSFIWPYDSTLDLFDPISYLTDKTYNSWVNSNTKHWNELIEDYRHNEKMCLVKLRSEIESTRPKKTSSDVSVPELERNNKKMSHITTDREDR